jgi:DNA polymerase-3 subunit delta
MAKNKAPAIQEIEKQLKQKKILPVYYLFGEDGYSLNHTLESIQKAMQPFITSDFDREIFYGESRTFSDIISLASTFPFGSQKKLIIFKQADKPRDKKEFIGYVKSPSDFTVLVCIHDGTISSTDSEPYKSLAANNFLFEAKELKGANLIEWLISRTREADKTLSYENAQVLVDISGENRSALESQLEKIFTFLGSEKEITIESIKNLSTSLKEYSIFDLQNAIGTKDKSNALKIAFNLLQNGMEPTQIIAMLNKYLTGIARTGELIGNKTPDQAAARIVGTHPYYYKNYIQARNIYRDSELTEAFRALLKADISLKTTSLDHKALISILIAEMIKD